MDGVERSEGLALTRYFFFAAGLAAPPAAPPPNGFGGSATPLRAGAELPAAFAFAPFAGFTGAAGGSGGAGATAATTGGARSGAALATLATEAEGDDVGEEAALALALVAAVFGRGASSEAPAMISAAVPTTTHTPRSTRQTRSAMLGFGAAANDAVASEGIIERWLGSASGA